MSPGDARRMLEIDPTSRRRPVNAAAQKRQMGHPTGAERVGLPRGIRACLFDLDGVLTQTAQLHAEAWKDTFDRFLQERSTALEEPFVPFDAALDYDRHVDGRAREDGVREFLASRGITADAETVGAIAERKNDLVHELIRRRGLEPYAGSARYVRAVAAAGLRRAVVSASANCRAALEAAGLTDLFEVRIDAARAVDEHLRGKPAPDTFLAAARALDVEPAAAAVFEDSLAGVAAGRAGDFGLVVGVDRTGHADELRRAGADVVVADLEDLLRPR
jgi:beta-phosphoglucomutase family hydrolase